MDERKIEKLSVRRQRRTGAFVAKTAANPRFQHWFPRREGVGRDLRTRRGIQEIRSATTRQHNGPMAYIRRRANELGFSKSALLEELSNLARKKDNTDYKV